LPKLLWDGGNIIVVEVKGSYIKKLSELLWDGGNIITTEVKPFQVGELP
jgi:hypothetical protein